MNPPDGWLNAVADVRDRRVVVMGLGAFGGGRAAVRFLAERGACVTVTDLKTERQLGSALDGIRHLTGVRFQLGGHVESEFESADLVVVNPAVPLSHPLLVRACRSGALLTSEINLFWLHNRGRVVGVTGTTGKSTTATLIHAFLQASGIPSRLGGNIGRSLLPEADAITPDEWIVLELSSFQLQTLDRLRARPDVSVVTNFAPNHLDRHASLEDYRAAKQALLRHQTPDDTAVLNSDDAELQHWDTPARRLGFGRTADHARIEPRGVLLDLGGGAFRLETAGNAPLAGAHQRANVAAAALAASTAGARADAMQSAVHHFRGLPHRLQYLGEKHGRRFYNDSKATTPEAAAAALEAVADASRNCVLLAGGADKHVDLQPLVRRIVSRVKAVALMGDTAPLLAAAMDRLAVDRPPERWCAPSFEAAFAWAAAHSAPGDVILLSPGCSSFGWFENYEQRGERFCEAVQHWSPLDD